MASSFTLLVVGGFVALLTWFGAASIWYWLKDKVKGEQTGGGAMMALLGAMCLFTAWTGFTQLRDGRVVRQPQQVSSGSPRFPSPSSINRLDVINDHWDEIKDHVNGSETVEACTDSGCYDLEADISNGSIETLYFPNGGYQLFSADIDEGGSASDIDQRGRLWEFTLDMDSSVVEDAVNEWAEVNGRVIE